MKNKTYLFILLVLINLSFPLFSNNQAYIQITSFISQNPSSGKGSYIKFEKTDQAKNIDISSDRTVVKVNEAGTYIINFSAQCGSNDFGATGFVDCWFEKNGKPLPGSNTRASVDSQDSTQVLSAFGIDNFEVNDELAVIFSASGPGVGITSFIQQSRPSVSSAELALIRIN